LAAFGYRTGAFFVEDVDVADIAANVGTPFYCYSANALRKNYREFAKAISSLDPLIAFSVKANSNLSVLRILAREGAGADIVSGGELQRALRAGIPASKIVFSGVGKTREEMALALSVGIFQFNVESDPELQALHEVAASKGVRAPVAIRVNPDVEAGGHKKISTGKAENKFGVPLARAVALAIVAAKSSHIVFKGLATHIGSQIADTAPFEAAFQILTRLAAELRANGIAVETLDFGGGLGVAYRAGESAANLPRYAELLAQAARSAAGARIIMEPGRVIAATAGILVAKVEYVKRGAGRDFLVLDAGMNDLIRPALYDAHHEIVAVRDGAKDRVYDVVGPVCESGDRFGRERRLPEMKSGDLVAVLNAGAYGAALSSQYNSRPLVPEILVDGGAFSVVRRRPSFEDMVALET
jgi:diaminopimelate decarboxylase